MCGISGMLGKISEKKLDAMVFAQNHRGPDGTGKYIFGNLALGHNRLKIRGLNSGKQPIVDGQNALAYNGEIYNTKELEEELKESYECDSNLLFELLTRFGTSIIQKLEGEFAFAFASNDSLYLTRDPFGVKPLYYYEGKETFYFASEIKALILCMKEKAEIGYIDTKNYVKPYGDYTPIKQIRQVLPGTIMKIKHAHGQFQKNTTQYFELKSNLILNSRENASQVLEKALETSIEEMMASDVKVGLLLSGGIDSAILAYVLSKQNKKIQAFSVGSEEQNEFEDAQIVAEEFGLDLKTIILDENFILEQAGTAIKNMETFDAGQLPTAIAMEKLFSKVTTKVVLSGEGADELFGGYEEFFSILRGNNDPKLFEKEIISATKNMYQRQLPRLDKMSLAHSIEARLPFLHQRFANASLMIDTRLKHESGREKAILFNTFKNKLPKKLHTKHKERFGVSAGVKKRLERTIGNLQPFATKIFQETYCNTKTQKNMLIELATKGNIKNNKEVVICEQKMV
ncbi:MAG: asparagine synthase (glutamine-hydrolyzing) [Parcubacteria group bacterium]|jgi:asparagine synthase (glutamine-hydrolysing)